MGKTITKNINKKDKEKKYILILTVSLLCIFLGIICVVSINKQNVWKNGEQLHKTKGVVCQVYTEDNINYYSEIKYIVEEIQYKKWFQIELIQGNEINVYYAKSNPLEYSRLTSPINETLYSTMIVIILFSIISTTFCGIELLEKKK